MATATRRIKRISNVIKHLEGPHQYLVVRPPRANASPQAISKTGAINELRILQGGHQPQHDSGQAFDSAGQFIEFQFVHGDFSGWV